MTQAQLIRKLYGMAEAAGSQRALAVKLGISEAYLSDVLHERREPGDLILKSLGLHRKVLFVPNGGQSSQASANPPAGR